MTDNEKVIEARKKLDTIVAKAVIGQVEGRNRIKRSLKANQSSDVLLKHVATLMRFEQLVKLTDGLQRCIVGMNQDQAVLFLRERLSVTIEQTLLSSKKLTPMQLTFVNECTMLALRELYADIQKIIKELES